MAKIQIDEQLFCNLCRYFELHDRDGDPEALRIRDALRTKLDALAARELYTQSKTASTPEGREAARLRYLELRGIDTDFRW